MRIYATFLSFFLLTGCAVEPEPLDYGKDACHTCKMTLVDKKFGAEIVTKKGKVYKFDDVNCMINFYNSDHKIPESSEFILVTDFDSSASLIPAKDALYLKSPAIQSPMASEVAAFSSKEQFNARRKEWNGIALSWGELVTQFK